MKRYYLRVRLESPVSISAHENRDGQTIPSLDYIPGSTLRGALAWRWLRENPGLKEDADFKRLLDTGLWCGPLYPDSNDTRSSPHVAQVLPVTARTCKHQPGFASDEAEKKAARLGHGVWDTLAALVEEAAMQRWEKTPPPAPVEALDGLSAISKCLDCESSLDRLPGYYESGEHPTTKNLNFWKSKTPKRMITRSAILPGLQSTAPDQLYSREAMEAGQYLAGWLWVDEAQEAWIAEKMGGSILNTDDILYVGAARTAGFGRVQVTDCAPDWGVWSKWAGDSGKRLDAFQTRLPASITSQWSLVPITLLSDAILLDPFLRYSSALTPEVLGHYASLHARLTPQSPPDPWPASTALFVAATRTRRIAGWNTAEGGKRPRSDDWAVAAGSVFVLAAAPAHQAQLRAACAWLEQNGIGERREDGFGQVVVAHPFHNQKEAM
ncbi:MAG: hypothetical protein KF893_26240 [Caldilineaceae bacterium]|nr:hypothetical protein [Caldilineaceae bacterium]